MSLVSTVVFSPSWSNPRWVLPLNLSLCLAALAHHAVRAPAQVALAGAAGLALWTLLEYAIHRGLMHRTRRSWQRWMWIHLHRDHHQQVELEDPAHRCVSAMVTAPLMLGLFFAAASSPWALALLAGVGLGFTLYELVHFAEHNPRARRALRHWAWFQRRLAKHASHHSVRPDRDFGFLTSFWDRLFGTLVR